jgi:RND family efflux transporter MFP subunit
MKRVLWILIVVLGSAVLAGIGFSGKSEQDEKPARATKPPVAVEAIYPIRGEVVEVVEVIGSLRTKSEASVQAENPGVLAEVLVTDWVAVKKGDVLARLDTRELEANVMRFEAEVTTASSSLSRTQADLDHAWREFQRTHSLNQASVVPEKSYDEAKHMKSIAEAELAAARARLLMAQAVLKEGKRRLEKAVLRTPIDGVICQRRANVGDRVDGSGGGEPLFRILDNRVLDLVLSVPSTSLWKVKTGQPIAFTTDAFPGRTFEAEIKYINPRADSMTRSVDILAEVQNEAGELCDGLFVKAQITTGRREGVLQIPHAAILQGDDAELASYVFVVDGDVARLRKVKPGDETGGMAEILEGLEEREPVVTRGAFLLHDGDSIQVESPSLRLGPADGA